MKRREFLKTSLTASTLAGLGTASLNASAADSGAKGQEYYELRCYRLKAGVSADLLDAYLEKAAISAWNRQGIKPVGVFKQQQRPGTPDREEIVDTSGVLVLIPHPSFESFATASSRMNEDAEYQQAGTAYLQTVKTNPAFDRIDSWLMLAFAGMPRIELSSASRDKKPRMFELRTYESYSELKALKKVAMFNSGEIDIMREVGLAPVFYGQSLIGKDLPHLKYMLSAEDEAAHKKHWGEFGKHPGWKKLQSDHQYDDTVSKITKQDPVPASYSQI